MMETFDGLKDIFPTMPQACERALKNTVNSLREDSPRPAFRPMRRALVIALALLCLTVSAYAALRPQIIELFSREYGRDFGAWMESGNYAQAHTSTEAGGAVFTIQEVLQKGFGLYLTGTIAPQDGYILLDEDCSVEEPFGYNIHHGEKAPEGTPTIAQKAEESGSAIRFVHCDLEKIGVEDGVLLSPDCWGYDAKVRRDGTIDFLMEVEDGLTVEPGVSYTLELSANAFPANADGTADWEHPISQSWSVTVLPKPFEDNEGGAQK